MTQMGQNSNFSFRHLREMYNLRLIFKERENKDPNISLEKGFKGAASNTATCYFKF